MDEHAFVMQFVRTFVLGEEASCVKPPLCERFRVDAAFVAKLLRGKLTVADVHSDFLASPDPLKTSAAQCALFRDVRAGVVAEKPFLVHAYFPFICATPDLLLQSEELGLYIGLIRSASFSTGIIRLLNAQNTKIHLLAVLETFNLPLVTLYGMEPLKEYPDHYQLKHMLQIKNQNFLFKRRKRLIEGYVEFLKDYFSTIYNISVSTQTLLSLKDLLRSKIPYRAPKEPFCDLTTLVERIRVTGILQKVSCAKLKTERMPHGLQ